MPVDTAPQHAVTVPSPQVVRRPTAGSVVVGLDGSTGSRTALDHGCDEGALRGLPVTAVVAWTLPDAWMTPYPLVPSVHDLHSAALDLARDEIRGVLTARAARGASTPTLELVAASGPPAVVLEDLSREAAMLVVGHRGRGGIASRLIGSVGLSVVVHARCTVVVVHTDAAALGPIA